MQQIIDEYNGYIPYVIQRYSNRGFNIQGVSQSNINLNGPDHDSIWADDPIHPGDIGFLKMASNFFLGIQSVNQRGMISAPTGSFAAAPFAPLGPIAGDPSTKWAKQCDYDPSWPSSPVASFPGPSINPNFQQSWGGAQDFTKGAAGQAVNSDTVWLKDFDSDVSS